MGRKLGYIPEGGALVEVTCRTLQGRLLLRPYPELNDLAAGASAGPSGSIPSRSWPTS